MFITLADANPDALETLPFSVYDVEVIPEPEKVEPEKVEPEKVPNSPNTERILREKTLMLGEGGEETPDEVAKSPPHPAMPEKPASGPAASEGTPEACGESGGSKIKSGLPKPFDAMEEQELPTNRIKHQVGFLNSCLDVFANAYKIVAYWSALSSI